MACVVVPLNFNVFLEKAKLKDDGRNYTDWVHNLRIILIAAQKNYVLEAPLGARPAAGPTPDVMNVWQSKADDYSIVQCAMLYDLEFTSVLPEYAPLLQFIVPRHHMMIGCDNLYVHIQRVQASFAHAEYSS